MSVSTVVQNWWETLKRTETPERADLAFFRHRDHEWQVMMIAETEPLRVVGACPVVGCVTEIAFDEYVALGWEFLGFRSTPVESPEMMAKIGAGKVLSTAR